MKQKVVLPQAYEISSDRAPTRDEIRRILLRSKLPTKAAISTLASSGMRLGELAQLKVSNIQFGENNSPSRIILKPSTTKTRKRRLTFVSPEATELLKEYLGEKTSDPNMVLLPGRKRCALRPYSQGNSGQDSEGSPTTSLQGMSCIHIASASICSPTA